MAERFWARSVANKSSAKTPDIEAAKREGSTEKAPWDGEKPIADTELPRRPWDEYQMGYPRFAAFIAEDKDKSSTIYRKFERLAARNLLYLESELAELEKKQDAMDEDYQLEPHESKKSSRSWKALRNEAPKTFYDLDGGPELAEVLEESDSDVYSGIESSTGRSHVSQRKSKTNRKGFGERRQDDQNSRNRLLLAFRIRSVLREYYEFLKLQSEILALSKPDRRAWKATRKVFKNYNPHSRQYRSEMIGEEMMSHLDNENKHDLCVLSQPIERDRLTRLLEGRLAWIFRRRTKQGSTYYVPEQRVKAFVTVFSIVAAAAFLIGAIVGLYIVKDPSHQLIMLGGFTIGFAGALGLLTNARRQDVFGASAAYAAVLVVFVSGNLSGNSDMGVPSGTSTSIVPIFTTLTSTTTSILQATATMTSIVTTTVASTMTLAASGSSTTAVATTSSNTSSGISDSAIIGIIVGALFFSIVAFLGIHSGVLRRKRGPIKKEAASSVQLPSSQQQDVPPMSYASPGQYPNMPYPLPRQYINVPYVSPESGPPPLRMAEYETPASEIPASPSSHGINELGPRITEETI